MVVRFQIFLIGLRLLSLVGRFQIIIYMIGCSVYGNNTSLPCTGIPWLGKHECLMGLPCTRMVNMGCISVSAALFYQCTASVKSPSWANRFPSTLWLHTSSHLGYHFWKVFCRMRVGLLSVTSGYSWFVGVGVLLGLAHKTRHACTEGREWSAWERIWVFLDKPRRRRVDTGAGPWIFHSCCNRADQVGVGPWGAVSMIQVAAQSRKERARLLVVRGHVTE